MMERQEYLAWAKTRAMVYVRMGVLEQAVASLQSDLNKRRGDAPEEEFDTAFFVEGTRMLLDGKPAEAVVRWIEAAK